MHSPKHKNISGFTLLEVLLVLFILGMLAAMVIPAMGLLDNHQRERITRQKMDMIRRAILGPDDRYNAEGRPIIGGYVGDMKAWPGLWEARAEIKPSFTGTGWDTPSSMTSGLGQGPDYTVNDSHVFRRPSGSFVKGRWKWNTPYRKLTDDATGNADHIGGLETENEGQPRGLWARYPEELNFDIGTHTAPGEDLGVNWKGPYLTRPVEEKPADSDHWAENDGEYDSLEPIWLTSHGYETWEDGEYSSGASGELFDDKESFRMLQTDGHLTDGWDRALRFFITADPDHDGGTIFWIISEGPDHEGVYPNKGTCSSHAWTVDADDTMGKAYDENADENLDNIVMKLYSRDWEAIFAEQTQTRTDATHRLLENIRRALVGHSPTDRNFGFTGDVCAWPRLFRWENNGTTDDTSDDYWDDENEDSTPVAYTKGQPRGLWTATPNSDETTGDADDLDSSQWGIGWRHAYLQPPVGSGGDQVLLDAWGRKILFFEDTANGLWLILSRGPDGFFDFGDTDTLPEGSPDGTNDYQEPATFTEAVDVTSYDPTAMVNVDNCHVIVAESDWQPGFFRLLGFTVTNAYLLDATYGTTKARFFRANGTPVSGIDLLVPSALTDEDGDLVLDDWAAGDGTLADPALNYDDTTGQTALSGARYLVFWNDADLDDAIDSGEYYYPVIYNVKATAGSGQYDSVTVDIGDFRELP